MNPTNIFVESTNVLNQSLSLTGNGELATQSSTPLEKQTFSKMAASVIVKHLFPYLGGFELRRISSLTKKVSILSHLGKIDYLNQGNRLSCILQAGDLPIFATKSCYSDKVKFLNLSVSLISTSNWDEALPKIIGLFPNLDRLVINRNSGETLPNSCLNKWLTEKIMGLRLLDLASNKLGNEGVGILASKVTLLVNLQTLKLSSNNINENAGQHLAQLACLPALEELDLEGNHIGKEGIQSFLTHLNQPLKLYTLNLGRTHIGSEGMKFLAAAFDKFCSLRFLDLSGNGIFFNRHFTTIAQLPDLKTFKFNQNFFVSRFLDMTVDFISPIKPEQLGFADIGMHPNEFLQVLISRSNLLLQVRNLDLSRREPVGHNESGELVANLINGLPQLKILNIKNLIQESEELRKFLALLEKPSWDKLTVDYYNMYDEFVFPELLPYAEKLSGIKVIALGSKEVNKFNEALQRLKSEETFLTQRTDLTPQSEEWRQFFIKKTLLVSIRKGYESDRDMGFLRHVKDYR